MKVREKIFNDVCCLPGGVGRGLEGSGERGSDETISRALIDRSTRSIKSLAWFLLRTNQLDIASRSAILLELFPTLGDDSLHPSNDIYPRRYRRGTS